MSTLYIANVTKQAHRFAYREAGKQGQPFQRTIKAGQQIALENLTSEEVKVIVDQHTRYGMCKAEEFSRRRNFAHLVYSDAEIDVDRMLQTYEVNDQKLDTDAEKRREHTAAAMSEAIGKEIEKETGVNVGPPARLTTETVEETPGEGGPRVAAGVQVVSRDIKTGRRAAR
jgi:hypothetical protein